MDLPVTPRPNRAASSVCSPSCATVWTGVCTAGFSGSVLAVSLRPEGCWPPPWPSWPLATAEMPPSSTAEPAAREAAVKVPRAPVPAVVAPAAAVPVIALPAAMPLAEIPPVAMLPAAVPAAAVPPAAVPPVVATPAAVVPAASPAAAPVASAAAPAAFMPPWCGSRMAQRLSESSSSLVRACFSSRSSQVRSSSSWW